jgi:hypothetical protein
MVMLQLRMDPKDVCFRAILRKENGTTPVYLFHTFTFRSTWRRVLSHSAIFAEASETLHAGLSLDDNVYTGSIMYLRSC